MMNKLMSSQNVSRAQATVRIASDLTLYCVAAVTVGDYGRPRAQSLDEEVGRVWAM